MAVGRAEIRQAAPLSDEHGEAGTQPQRYSHRGEEETERRRPVAMGRRGHLVQHAAGEAGARQTGMHIGDPEPGGSLYVGKDVQPLHGPLQGGDALCSRSLAACMAIIDVEDATHGLRRGLGGLSDDD